MALGNWRQPTMDFGRAQLLAPVAHMLDELFTLIVPARDLTRQLPLPSICAALQIIYPGALSKSETHAPFTITKGGPFTSNRGNTSKGAVHGAKQYWTDSPTTWTYKSICRFIRRHVIEKRNRLSSGDATGKNYLLTLGKVRLKP